MDKEKNINVIALAIHPKYAHAIISGEKKVEFRRNGVPRNITHILIYSTKPDQKIIGYCEVNDIVVATIQSLWKNFGKVGLINRDLFLSYYENYNQGTCYILKNPKKFKNPIPLNKCNLFKSPPQSFVYISSSEWKNIKRKLLVD